MSETKDALWAETTPDCDGQSRYWEVGKPLWTVKGPGPTITRITVQTDLPGLHCDMRRICVWVDDGMVAEAPVLNLGAIGYPLPAREANNG